MFSMVPNQEEARTASSSVTNMLEACVGFRSATLRNVMRLLQEYTPTCSLETENLKFAVTQDKAARTPDSVMEPDAVGAFNELMKLGAHKRTAVAAILMFPELLGNKDWLDQQSMIPDPEPSQLNVAPVSVIELSQPIQEAATLQVRNEIPQLPEISYFEIDPRAQVNYEDTLAPKKKMVPLEKKDKVITRATSLYSYACLLEKFTPQTSSPQEENGSTRRLTAS